MEYWRDNLETNSKRLSHIYETGTMSDVTFLAGRNPEIMEIFRLHKFVLAMCSDVFNAMFYRPFREKDEVKATDIAPSIFGIVMKFVYEDSFSVQSMEEAIGTYCAADKYKITPLLNLCFTYITTNIRPENIPLLYEMPRVLEALQVKSKCEKVLSEKTAAVVESENFAEAPLDLVKSIVQLNKLNIKSEVELFELVMKWAKNSKALNDVGESDQKKALREKMDHFLPHIRFLSMSKEEFLSGPITSGILTDSEIVAILQNLIAPGCRDLPSWCNKITSRTLIHSPHPSTPSGSENFLLDKAMPVDPCSQVQSSFPPRQLFRFENSPIKSHSKNSQGQYNSKAFDCSPISRWDHWSETMVFKDDPLFEEDCSTEKEWSSEEYSGWKKSRRRRKGNQWRGVLRK